MSSTPLNGVNLTNLRKTPIETKQQKEAQNNETEEEAKIHNNNNKYVFYI